MNVPRSNTSHLVRNQYGYCFRIVVPKDLRDSFGIKELRYSLKTGNLAEARSSSRLMAANVETLFRAIRQEDPAVKNLTPELVRQLVKKFHENAIGRISKPINPFNPSSSFERYMTKEVQTPTDLRVHKEALEHFISWYELMLATGQYDEVAEKAAELLKEAGVGYDRESELFCTLCKGLLKSEIEQTKLELKLVSGGAGSEFDDILAGSLGGIQDVEPGVQEEKKPQTSVLISEVISKFTEENKVNWSPKTEFEVRASLDLFIEFLGDVPIQEVNRRKVAEYKETLKKLPPNKNKTPKYRGKNIQELVKMNVSRTLSVERINKNLQRVGMLFKYSIQNGFYEGPNPATEMQVPKDRWETEKRAPFTNHELEKLFRSSEYLEDSFSKSYMYWTPIIALFHGMRQNEIAGLHLDDIKKSEDGVWYFDLFSRKSTPSKARRVAPIHPFVLGELNFVALVDHLRKAGKDRLFPELSQGRDGYAKAVSAWFNGRYKDKCGITSDDGRMRDFHSFRATFITHLRHKKVHDRMLKEVVGHSVSEDVTDRYTDPYPIAKLLAEVVSKASYHEEIDLSHLPNSKYVIQK